MALPILLQKLFQNGGAGDKLNTSILPAASTTAVGAARIASSAEATAGTDATKIMTPALTKQAIDKFAPVKTVNGNGPDSSGDIQVAGLPLGHLFAWPFQTPPDGAIQCNGATYNRTLYADFFAYASSKGWVKTEAEWQSLASANGGYCPYYSDGDGSTTFRTPKFAPFMQVAIASGNVGAYRKAGLPNITGEAPLGTCASLDTSFDYSGSAIYRDYKSQGYREYNEARDGDLTCFDASRSNPIYGRSTTVQPESHEWMICVVVAGKATNIGSVDVGNVMSAVAQVQAQVGAIPTPSAYITKTWRSGSNWYRRWSDGFIEQGGLYTSTENALITLTLNTPFSSTDYAFYRSPQWAGTASSGTYYCVGFVSKARTSVQFRADSVGYYTKMGWYACGY